MIDWITWIFAWLWILTVFYGVLPDIWRCMRAKKKVRNKKMFAIFCETTVGAVVAWQSFLYLWHGKIDNPELIFCIMFIFFLCITANDSDKWHDEDGK